MREQPKCSARRREPGADVLHCRATGTGTSEFAPAVASAAGRNADWVHTVDDEGDPVDVDDRLQSQHGSAGIGVEGTPVLVDIDANAAVEFSVDAFEQEACHIDLTLSFTIASVGSPSGLRGPPTAFT